VVLAGLKANPHANELLSVSLDEALAEIEKRLGPDESHWSWGKLHETYFRHPLNALPPADALAAPHSFGLDSASGQREHLLDSFDLPPVPRPGDANTVNATGGGNYAAAYGASYREIIDVNDWDRSVMTNVPGESGVPGDKHYDDLVGPWSRGEYHPLPFSRKAVEAATEERILLVPAK
jgi:penicillin G amidase